MQVGLQPGPAPGTLHSQNFGVGAGVGIGVLEYLLTFR